MKKILTIAMVLTLVAAFAVPAMAETKFDFKGAYRVRGFYLSNPALQADQEWKKATGKMGSTNYTAEINSSTTGDQLGYGETASQAYMDMRFRMESTFTVSDALQVVTRFDALDNKKWGDADTDWSATGACMDSNNNIDFDRAYMVITNENIGKFSIGRQAGGVYGNVFLDSVGERDRLRYDTKVGDLAITAIFEKQAENDSDSCDATVVSLPGGASKTVYGSDYTDSDTDFYYLALTYLTEDLTGGLLTGFGVDKANSDDIFTGVIPNVIPEYDRTTWLFDPFINATFGDFTVLAEAQIRFGKYAEYDRDVYGANLKSWNALRNAAKIGDQEDIDWDAYAWNLEGQWNSGPFGAELGYAWVKGEDNLYDDKFETIGGVGDDWAKAWILTSTDSGFESTLGGHTGAAAAGATAGNLSSGSTAALNGMKMFYLGGSFAPMENLTIKGLYANSKSESPGYVGFTSWVNTPNNSRSFASDHGSEYDLTVDWDIYDNLNYTAIFAYLDVGDYWQWGNPYRELENVWTFWQQLQLDF